MSPQFVDLNADGKLDIVAGVFGGSPQIAYGSDKGYLAPVELLDANGELMVINQFWNVEAKKWDSTDRCSPKGGEPMPKGHGTSAWAFDWDADGDLDILLGDHDAGYIYRRINQGTAREPKFSGTNLPLMAAGKPLQVPGTCTTMRTIDWDGDGRMDLMAGGMGDSYQDGLGGGVYLWRNIGFVGSPEFAAPVTLIEASAKAKGDAPSRPDAGLYMDAGDIDGDGDLDVLVGGYSMWKPAARELKAEEQARVETIRAEMKALNEKTAPYVKELSEAIKGLSQEEATKKRAEVYAKWKPTLDECNTKRAVLQKELDTLVPRDQRVSFTWLYENLTAKPAAAAATGKTETASKE